MSDKKKSLAITKSQLNPAEFQNTRRDLLAFVKGQLKETKNIANGESGDYGVIPYTKKKSLLKPGAEKLLKLFGFTAKNELVKEIEDWDKHFIYYRYKCTIVHGASEVFIADATRSCNNKEKKHATKDVYDVANTIEAVAQKRALVAAVVQATMASEIFDADVSGTEDAPPNRPSTEDQDPRRIRVMGRYFISARDRGFTPEQAKAAAHRKLNAKSLTEITTADIEKLTGELIAAFRYVGDGNKPEKFAGPRNEDSEPSGEKVIEERKYYCRGKKHGEKDEKETSFKNMWCSPACRESYYPAKTKSKLDALIAKGKKNNVDGESETAQRSLHA